MFFERVVFKYIFNFLLDNSLIYKCNSGFMHVHQLIKMYHNIRLSLENREVIFTVFCYISKAFDKVWHHGLLKKIKLYGISGNLYEKVGLIRSVSSIYIYTILVY